MNVVGKLIKTETPWKMVDTFEMKLDFFGDHLG